MTFNDLINKYLKRDVKKIESNTEKNEKENQKEPKTNKLAKDRLHVLLVQDRASVSAEFIDLMKEEVVEVVKKYVTVDDEGIGLNMKSEIKENGKTEAGLVIRIPILNIRNEMKSQKVKEDELEAIDKRFDEKKESALKTQETIKKIDEENIKSEEISKQEFEEIKENMFKEDEREEARRKLDEVEAIEEELEKHGDELFKIQEDLVKRINKRDNTNKTYEELKEEILSGNYDDLEIEDDEYIEKDGILEQDDDSEILKKLEEELEDKARKLKEIKKEISENILKGSKSIEEELEEAKSEIERKNLEEKLETEKDLEEERVKKEKELQKIQELRNRREDREDIKRPREEKEEDSLNENQGMQETIRIDEEELDLELEDTEGGEKLEDDSRKSLDIYTRKDKSKHSKETKEGKHDKGTSQSKSLLSDDKTMIFDPKKVNDLLEKQTNKKRKNKRR